MSYKTILVHVDPSRNAAHRIKIAAELALAENAHLIGAAMTGISRFAYQDSTIDLSRTIVASYVDTMNQHANEALVQFEAIAQRVGVSSYEKRLVNDEPEGALCLQARFCDLVVVGQTDPDDSSARVISDLPEYVVLNCARPVLIVPYADRLEHVGTNALLAWDGSMEATRAMAGAIGLLQRARNVTLALFNTGQEADTHGAQAGAGAELARYLARHGIRAELAQQATELDVGDALLALAADRRSDLIVMGGYGHTRLREALLGGVSMTMLTTMTVPVLMSH